MASYWIIRQAQKRREEDATEKLKQDNALKRALEKIEQEKNQKLTFFEWMAKLKHNKASL